MLKGRTRKLECFFFADALLGIWCVARFWKEKFGRFSRMVYEHRMIASCNLPEPARSRGNCR